jgi:hypothetical protein
LFMNTVQIQLKSRDSKIPGFQLDLKIVFEFQLRTLNSLPRIQGLSVYIRHAEILILGSHKFSICDLKQ